jgi:hypothetical protein
MAPRRFAHVQLVTRQGARDGQQKGQHGMDSICGRSQRAAVPALPGIYAVITSIEATGSASNPSRAPALARTMASICAVDWLPTRSQTTFGGLP